MPKSTLSIPANATNAVVHIEGWTCVILAYDKAQKINAVISKQPIQDINYIRSFATEIIDADKYGDDLRFFDNLYLFASSELQGKGTTIQNVQESKWKGCYGSKELTQLRSEMLRWAKYILEKLGAPPVIEFRPEKVDFGALSAGMTAQQTIRVSNAGKFSTASFRLITDSTDNSFKVLSVNGVSYLASKKEDIKVITLEPGESVSAVVELSLASSINKRSQGVIPSVGTNGKISYFIMGNQLNAKNSQQKKEGGKIWLGHLNFDAELSPSSLQVEIFDATDVADDISENDGLLMGKKPVDEAMVYRRATSKRVGYVADGNAALLVRAQTNNPDRNILFKLGGEKKYGSLARLDRDPDILKQSIKAEAVDKKNKIYQATSVIVAPERFPVSQDENAFFITVCLESLDRKGECDAGIRPVKKHLDLRKAPVVLVHGLWAGPESWGGGGYGLLSTLQRNDYKVVAVKYPGDRGPSETMRSNSKLLLGPILNLCLQHMREGYACTRADLVAHSMGGLVSRKFIEDNDNYYNPSNFNVGSVRRLITIDTPHYGSGFANLLSGDNSQINNCIQYARTKDVVVAAVAGGKKGGAVPALGATVIAASKGWPYLKALLTVLMATSRNPYGTAIRDLKVGSKFLYSLNSNEQQVTSFALIGDTGHKLVITEGLDLTIAIMPTGCTHKDLFGGQRSDSIVSLSSQNGRSKSAKMHGVPHLGEGVNRKVIDWVLKLLQAPIDSFSKTAFLTDPSPIFKQNSAGLPDPTLSQNIGTLWASLTDMLISKADAAEEGNIQLTIATPSPLPGQSFTLRLDGVATGAADFVLLNDGIGGPGASHLLSASPWQWKIKLPANFSGSRTFQASVIKGQRVTLSNPVIISYQPDLSRLKRLIFSPVDPLVLHPGQSRQLTVMGRFADGYNRNLTSQETGARYSEKTVDGLQRKEADSESIETSENGLLLALKPGEAVVVAHVGGLTIGKRVSVVPVSLGDADGDGLTDQQEEVIGTNPFSPDSDGDGSSDMIEVGSNSQQPLRMVNKDIINALNPAVMTIRGNMDQYFSLYVIGGRLVSATVQEEKYFPSLKTAFPDRILPGGILDMEIAGVDKSQKVVVQVMFQPEMASAPSFMILEKNKESMAWKLLRNITIKQESVVMTFADNFSGDSDPGTGSIRITGGFSDNIK